MPAGKKISRLSTLLMAVAGLLLACSPVYAFQNPAQSPPAPAWWQVIGGILAIPATLVGLAYSYILIKKTNLESKKIELEIIEKQEMLAQDENALEDAKLAAKPLIESQLVQRLVLRFIVLYLISGLWGLLAGGYSFILSSVRIVGYNYLGFGGFGRTGQISVDIFLIVLQYVPVLGTALIFVAIGWPLFKDVNKILGINIKATLMSPFKRRRSVDP